MMLRKARLIAPLLRSLLLGAVVVPAMLVTATTVTGCRDENDPMTHVDELKDPGKQPLAIKRLIQFYEDALQKDKKDKNGPNVKALLDKIIEPLNNVCLDTNVKDRTRSTLVKFLAELRDKRAEACLKKTLEDYKPDTNEEDVQNVMRTVAAVGELKSLAPQVMKVFTTMEFSRPKANLMKKDVTDAVLAVTDKAQEDELLAMIEKPIPSDNQQANANESFWQIVAVRALSNMKSEKAVRPFIKLILTPSKGAVANTALVGLVRIGKASIGPTEKLLKGEDTELVKHSEAEQLAGAAKDPKTGKPSEADVKLAGKAHIGTAAQILGSLGSEGSIAPLLSAVDAVKDDPATKVIIALTITQLPRSSQSVEAFKKVYEEVKLDLDVAGNPAKEALANTASDFFDASMASYLVKSSLELKGEAGEIDPVRSVALVTATKVMKLDQVAEVEALYNTKAVIEEDGGKKKDTTVGKTFEKEFAQSKELLTNCKDSVDCYFAALTNKDNQAIAKQFTAIKAAYMIGVLGKEGDRAKLADAFPEITNGAVLATAMKALKILTPKGDPALADKVEGLFTKAEEAKDEDLQKRFRDFPLVAAQLRARAQ
jgi:hypothetical protein